MKLLKSWEKMQKSGNLLRGGTEHATKEMNWAIPWKGQPEHENQISFKTLIIWYHWKTKTFKNSFLKVLIS